MQPLVDAARQAGVSGWELSGPPAPGRVPPGVGVCAYRIVQESLSNAASTPPEPPSPVGRPAMPGAVLLRVANGPGGAAGPSGSDAARSRAHRDA